MRYLFTDICERQKWGESELCWELDLPAMAGRRSWNILPGRGNHHMIPMDHRSSEIESLNLESEQQKESSEC